MTQLSRYVSHREIRYRDDSGNCICKLFDAIMMKKCDKVLHTSDQQFAFKQKHSTAMCSSVLIETVNYFVKGGSNVYGCFLDA